MVRRDTIKELWLTIMGCSVDKFIVQNQYNKSTDPEIIRAQLESKSKSSAEARSLKMQPWQHEAQAALMLELVQIYLY